jgi:uncharacterized protein (DUF1800 family)
MQTDPWAPYSPDDKAPWTLRRVVHLHRRAGFAATWDELQRDLKDGPQRAMDRLLTGQVSTRAGDDYAATGDVLSDAAVAAGDLARLRGAWLWRMLFGPDPLGEKLTLLWHDHFATGYAKMHEESGASAVEDVGLMRRQNDTLRKHARARFAELLEPSVREPALLLYLDAQVNQKGRPNENLGRELMELFTLGVGHYSETDVKEAARALTGWSVKDGQFKEIAARHDAGEKTILGKTGKWTGSDLVSLLLKHPATAQRIVVKLCRLFFGEKGAPAEALKALAAGLREHNLDVGWAVGKVLKSRLFFADGNIGTRVLGPVEFVVGSVRALDLFDPAPSMITLPPWIGAMGQVLFEPPNVGGWPFGRGWITTSSMIARANYIAALMQGPRAGRTVPYDAVALPKKYGFGSGPRDVLTFHHRLVFGTGPSGSFRKRTETADRRAIVERLLASPEAQLG